MGGIQIHCSTITTLTLALPVLRVSEIVVFATALVTCVTTIAASSCCAYMCSRTHIYTIEALKGKRCELRYRIEELKRKDVSDEVGCFITKAEAYLREEVNNESIKKVEKGIEGKCMGGLLPNLLAQKQALACMEKTFKKLEDLIEEGDEIWRKPGKRFNQDVAIVGKSRREEAENIWKQLVSETRESPTTICIHGPVGVGKTAIAKHTYIRAANDPNSHFDNVIWVDVEYGAGLHQVQDNMAASLDSSESPKALGGGLNDNSDSAKAALEAAGDDIRRRAGALKDVLSKKGKFLLVLDSMWQPDPSLDDIGIPELVGGRKLMVTSRIRSIFSEMGASKEAFQVQPLCSVDEAWELFNIEMGLFPQSLKEVIATDIKGVLLSELDGLPLAIIKLARILRHKHEQEQNPDDLKRVWRKELAALVKSPSTYIQHRDVELTRRHFNDSVGHLEEATKSCFMYCALFPNNYVIDSTELTEYWMWEGLLGDNFNTLVDKRDKGTEIINQLKNAHLLQTLNGDEQVKMLNFFRSMAIQVEGKRVCIKAGEFLTSLRPSVQNEWNPEVRRASFMENQLKALKLRGHVVYQNLSTLLLRDNILDSVLPDDLFDIMPNLRVLDLSRTSISILPSSLSRLTKLHALLLRGCSDLKNLPNLSNLQQLIVLDLWGTSIKHCPIGIQKMKNLRRFNLSQTRLETFPAGIIGTQLMDLEELLMIPVDNGGYVWRSKQLEEQWQGACIEDLLNLESLAVLELQFFSTQVFDIFIQKATEDDKVPPKFRFCVGGFQSGRPVGQNSVTITGDPSSMLPNQTEELHLIFCNKMMSVLELEQESLRHLQVLYVSNFNGLSYLFSVEIFRSLYKLRELHVRECKIMKEIVKPDERGNPTRIHLPKLIKMVLCDLPYLRSICNSPQLNCHAKLTVEVSKCENLNGHKINSEGMDNCSTYSDLDFQGETSEVQITPTNGVEASSCWTNLFSRKVDKDMMEQLKEKKNVLGDLIEDLEQKENRGVVTTPDLASVIEELKASFEKVSESTRKAEKGIDDMCMRGLLPDLRVRKNAQIGMENISSELNSLIEKAENVKQRPVKGYKQSGEVALVGKETRATAEDIWKQLVTGAWEAKHDVFFIHGVVGVGKTVVAKYIHNKALCDPTSPFDNVIWMYVESGDDLWKIQEQLANILEINLLNLHPNTNGRVERASRDILKARAGRLENELLEKGKFLLVIDSMWKPLCFDDIGIPKLVNGQKLIVTSSILDVCTKVVNKKMSQIQPLTTLDEAQQLFKNEVRYLAPYLEADEETFNNIQRALAELQGLPLAIKELAETLTEIKEGEEEKDIATVTRAWREELDYWAKLIEQPCNLERRDSKLFDRYKYFYKNLKEEMGRCFLLSALYPKNHVIGTKELIDLWMWEGFSGDVETLEERREKGRKTLNGLKNANLFLNVTTEASEQKVKIFNLFRSMTIQTMVNDGNRGFIRPAASLTELPMEYEWPLEVEKGSFMQNQIRALRLMNSPKFNRLSMLLLQDNPLNMDCDDKFFYSMPNLKFLDMSRTEIHTLPTSLSSLKILQILLLCNCPNLTSLPNLSNLRGLIVLDLLGTPLEYWPQGIGSMKKLRRLNLSQTRVATFPAKVVGQLTDLEELLMITGHGCPWGSTKVDKHWKGACVEELLGLKNLSVLELNFLNARVFNMYVKAVERESSVPPKFRFCVGKLQNGATVKENGVTVSDDHIITLPCRSISELQLTMCGAKIVMLKLDGWLRDLRVLDVSNFSGLSYLFSVKVLGSLKNLSKLCVRRCEEMNMVVQPAAEEHTPRIVLPALTTMVFFSLPKLESVCHGQVLDCPHLCSLQVWGCDRLKLPMILVLGERQRKIEVSGQRSWLANLEWDNPGNSNSFFEDKPHSHPSLKFVEAPVPPVLEATPTWVHTKDPQEETQSGSNKANGAQLDRPPTNSNWPLNFSFWTLLDGWDQRNASGNNILASVS